jgi:hypothetical protein
MRTLGFYTAAALALASASCGHSNRIYPVSGKVVYKGSPVVGASVFFQRQGADPLHEQTIMGLVQEDGSFTLVCGSQGAGAPPGEYAVLIEWRPLSDQAKGRAQRTPDKFKGRYADPKHPRLTAVVKAEANHLPAFELTD